MGFIDVLFQILEKILEAHADSLQHRAVTVGRLTNYRHGDRRLLLYYGSLIRRISDLISNLIIPRKFSLFCFKWGCNSRS